MPRRGGRWSGPAAMLGGLLWAVWAVLVAGKPEGCGDAACDLPGRSSRGYSDLSPLLGAAILLIAVGVVGMVMRSWSMGQFGQLCQWGLGISVTGGMLLVTSTLVQSLFFEGDFPLMPVFVIPGVLALAIGFVLFAMAVLRVIPRWAGIPLIVGAVALLGVNDQNARIPFAVPFGIGWELWKTRNQRPARLTTRPWLISVSSSAYPAGAKRRGETGSQSLDMIGGAAR